MGERAVREKIFQLDNKKSRSTLLTTMTALVSTFYEENVLFFVACSRRRVREITNLKQGQRRRQWKHVKQ